MTEKLLSATATMRRFRQPPGDLQEHLTGAVDQRLVLHAPRLCPPFGRHQHRQERQRPDPPRPRDRHQQHGGQPAQTARLDEMAMARPHWIPIDPARRDLRPPASFDRIIEPDDHGTGWDERRHQQSQKQPCRRQRRPAASAQDIMIPREASIPSEPGCSQGRGYRPSMRRQDRARCKHHDARPGRSRKQDRE